MFIVWQRCTECFVMKDLGFCHAEDGFVQSVNVRVCLSSDPISLIPEHLEHETEFNCAIE